MTEKNRSLPDLKHAVMNRVVTRFPPEASGYLHLGHIKALLLNYLYAKKYNGKIILRFDDTNPEKESVTYEQAILADINMLGLLCDETTYASDYFDIIMVYASKMIKNGLAYVDFSTPEKINDDRSKLRASQYRDTDIDTNYLNFMKMQSGQNKNCCLRAKIDYASKNGCMRDPVIYRSKNTPHPRHGTTYAIYPTYDFACPVLDAIQGVTHAMRSVEYRDRDSQYDWFLTKLELKYECYPIISDYGKLNFSHTVLSKRKLAKLVEASLVDGWSDPRMPTLRGLIRRGAQIAPLLAYIKTQSTSHNVVMLSWNKLWSFNTEYLNNSSNRIYGLFEHAVELTLTGDLPEYVDLPNHPKDGSKGYRKIFIGKSLLVDPEDFANVKIGDRYTLVGLGNVTVSSIAPLIVNYDKTDADYKSTVKITWLPNDNSNIKVTVRNYGNLLTKPKLEEGDDVIAAFNKNSVEETCWLLEKSVATYPTGSVFQLMRKNYCYVDKADPDRIVLNIIPSK